MKWKQNIRFSWKHPRRAFPGIAAESVRSYFIRSIHASLDREAEFPTPIRSWIAGSCDTMHGFLCPNATDAFSRINARSPPTRQNRLRWALFVYCLDLFIRSLGR